MNGGQACRLAAVVAAIGAGAALAAPGCGARSELELEGAPPPAEPGPSSAFCEARDYRGGWRDLSIYVLLDRSGSMQNDHKWDQASAALGSFVEDPKMAGLGVGLQYYPLSPTCDVASYAVPAVPFGRVPDVGPAIKSSLAAQVPEGDTPMRPALRGAIEYARALLLGDPTHGVAIALTTDGAPNACESTTDTVAAVAAEGAGTEPQVLTFVIGLETGYTEQLERIAHAGGTAAPIIIGGDDAAQELVDALVSVRDDLLRCRYAVPPAPGHSIVPRDVTVRYRLAPEASEVSLPRVTGPEACGADAFFVDESGGEVELCPSACARVHDSPEARVIVQAGCGEGSVPIDAGPPDGGACSSVPPFSCVGACGADDERDPDCVGGVWQCPAGTVSTQSCKECAVVPHGCCRPDGTQALASCIQGEWVCPPGSVIFGSPGCTPPEVCADTLPCPLGMVCELDDHSCGAGSLLGSCKAAPSGCPPGGRPVCACDGQSYPSECAAEMAGQDLSEIHDCPDPSGTFSCGPYFCSLSGELCLHVETPGELVAHHYECLAKPLPCAAGCAVACNPCPPCPNGKSCPPMPECNASTSGAMEVSCLQL